jgi:4-hydroxy-3-methylbut-2-enyl diphosphate reductase
MAPHRRRRRVPAREEMREMSKSALTVLLASPRGFCAGVDRAIQIVERAIERFGAPVYVRHEIVHNRDVVEALERKGAVFVEELDGVPEGVPVVFSAHGVAKSVVAEAQRRHLLTLDATCPLVSKVHHEAERHHAKGRRIILVGHEGHPEVVGTMGQLPEGAVLLVETVGAVERLAVPGGTTLAYVTQTTLSVDDAAEIVAALRRRFPGIHGPGKDDICYATTNRQQAVKSIAGRCDAMFVVGAANSSNSARLVDVARRNGCPRTTLIRGAAKIDWSLLAGVRRLGLTAGASAPEILVEEVIAACRVRYSVAIEEVTVTEETIGFNLPRALSA